MALLKLDQFQGRELSLNPAHVLALKAGHTDDSTHVFTADSRNPGLNKFDHVVHIPIDQLAAQFNQFFSENGAKEGLVKVVSQNKTTYWINPSHVVALVPGEYRGTTKILLTDPTDTGIDRQDILVPESVSDLTKLFNEPLTHFDKYTRLLADRTAGTTPAL